MLQPSCIETGRFGVLHNSRKPSEHSVRMMDKASLLEENGWQNTFELCGFLCTRVRQVDWRKIPFFSWDCRWRSVLNYRCRHSKMCCAAKQCSEKTTRVLSSTTATTTKVVKFRTNILAGECFERTASIKRAHEKNRSNDFVNECEKVSVVNFWAVWQRGSLLESVVVASGVPVWRYIT